VGVVVADAIDTEISEPAVAMSMAVDKDKDERINFITIFYAV
jgi:hypothetical protein